MANKINVDINAIRKAIEGRLISNPAVQRRAYLVASNIFFRAHQALMKDFFSHKITQELKAGNSASNISDTLNGEGNLFSFLGFFAGQDPTLELEELFSRINLGSPLVRRNSIIFNIENLPQRKDIIGATRMNWGSGASWAFAVETGSFNGDAALSHFIFKTWNSGRSKAGFQVKDYSYSEDQFSPKPYITEILDNFQERINGSKSKFLIK